MKLYRSVYNEYILQYRTLQVFSARPHTVFPFFEEFSPVNLSWFIEEIDNFHLIATGPRSVIKVLEMLELDYHEVIS